MANVYRNLAGQKIAVRAWNLKTGAPVTGDAANITAQISKDGGTAAATNDVNPTEIDATDHKGLYIFDLSLAESQADLISITPVSATADIVLDPVDFHTLPGAFQEMYKLVITQGNISDVSPTTTEFDTNLSEATNGHYEKMFLMFTGGPMVGAGAKISVYVGTNGHITLGTAMVTTPTNGNSFMILGRSE